MQQGIRTALIPLPAGCSANANGISISANEILTHTVYPDFTVGSFVHMLVEKNDLFSHRRFLFEEV